jgi:phosphoribosyl 1,2-cyclic phosphodiesterase
LLESERTRLLVDAGLGKKEIQRRFELLGIACERIDGVLVSHEHSDHAGALPQMARQWKAPIYLTEETFHAIRCQLPERAAKRLERVEYIKPGQRFTIGDIEVHAFAIPHDAADPIGFTLRANGSKAALVTDLGYLPELVKQHLRDSDCLILESNHDLDMLKVGPYPWYLKQRVMSRTGHLSNHHLGEFLSDPGGFDARAKYLVLAHLSEQNNTPDVARISAEEALRRRPAEAAFAGELLIASQHAPMGPLHV